MKIGVLIALFECLSSNNIDSKAELEADYKCLHKTFQENNSKYEYMDYVNKKPIIYLQWSR